MDNQTIFVVTLKGIGEIKNHTRLLPEDIKRALVLVDDESSVEILTRRAMPSLRAKLSEILQKLENGGFIQDKAYSKTSNVLRVVKPKSKTSTLNLETGDELDYTSVTSIPTPMAESITPAKVEENLHDREQASPTISVQIEAALSKAEIQASLQNEIGEVAKREAEMARLKSEQHAYLVRAEEAESVRMKAELEVAKAKAELEVARQDAEQARAGLQAARLEAGALAKKEAETLRLREEQAAAKAHAETEARAKREIEIARLKASQVADQVRAEAEAQRIKAEMVASNAKQELDAARLEAEQARSAFEAAKAEATKLAKSEAEATRLKAELETASVRAEAEAMRVKAELNAERARVELEAVRSEAERVRAELESARAEAEALAKREAEAARRNAEEAASRAQAEAEARMQQQAEAARLKAEQEAEKVRTEAEASRIKAELETEKARVELEAARLEAERVRAELESAKAEAEALAKREADAARRNAEEAASKAQAAAEARMQQQAEAARLKAEHEAEKVRAEAEASRIKAELETEKARVELEAARLEAERVRAELESARAEAETLAKREVEAARRREAEAATRAQAENEARIKQEAAIASLKAEQAVAMERAEHAEALRLKEVAEAERLEEAEAAAKAQAEAEVARIVVQIKADQDSARIKAEAEAKAVVVAEAARRMAEAEVERAHAEVESTRVKAQQDVARAKMELVALQAKAEVKVRDEAAEQIIQASRTISIDELALASKARADISAARSMIATVLFFDIAGYTKQPVTRQIELKAQFNKLVSEFIKDIEENQRIILDTGDGAAIGFLQHPEDAIEVVLKFRQAVTSNTHRDYPDLLVRMGIHLGPVNVVKDMNGQSNMVGDGINDAQRIMNFAAPGMIYISRAYYDVISRLNDQYAKLFQYRGVKNDKHERQHQVYEVSADETFSVDNVAGDKSSDITGQLGTPLVLNAFSKDLEPFVLNDLAQTIPGITSLHSDVKDISAESVKQSVTADNISLSELKIAVASTEKVARETLPTFVVSQPNTALPDNNEPVKIPQNLPTEKESEAQILARKQAQLIADAERMKAEVKAEKEARLMADEQAKAWTEAEQRAALMAAMQAKAEREAEESAKTLPAKAAGITPHARRKPIMSGRLALILFVFLLGLIAALPYVWPMQSYVEQLEIKLSAQLKQPVHIAKVKVAFFPLPKLELQEVSIGVAQELKASSVVLNFDILTLLSDSKIINSIELMDLEVSADSFAKALSWLQAAGGDAHYPIARLILKHAHITGDGVNLPSINGNADWDAQGHFAKTLLRSEDGKIEIALQAQQPNWLITLHLKESNLPWLPAIRFGEFNAKGQVSNDAAELTELDGRLYGGKLAGSAHLNWQNSWQLKGHLNLTGMELREALPQLGIDGEMDGDSSFMLTSTRLPQLANSLHLDGTFQVKKGVVSKIDIVETAANHHVAAGGRTHFDEISGSLQVENNSQHLRQLKISAGVMSANGSVDVSPGGQLSGHLSVDFKMRAGSSSLILSGSLAEPLLRPLN